MAGIFGIEGKPGAGHARAPAAARDQAPGRRLDQADRPDRRADERRPRGAGRADQASALALLDRPTYAVIAARRRAERPRRAPRHPLAAAAGADRGGRGAERPRTPRRAADPRPRRPRDDRQLARLGLGAPGPHPRRPRARCVEAVRSGDGRRGAGRGDDHRDDALAAGDPDHRPPGDGPLAARRLRGAGRHRRSR